MKVTPYAGYMFFGDYLKGPVGTTLTNAPALMYGTQFNLPLSPNVSLVGNLGYTSSDIQVGVPFFGGVGTGIRSTMYMYDAGLEYDFRSTKSGSIPFTPFVTGGVGAMHYNIDGDFLSTQATNLAGNVGARRRLRRGTRCRATRDGEGLHRPVQLPGRDRIQRFHGQTANNFALTAGLKFDF